MLAARADLSGGIPFQNFCNVLSSYVGIAMHVHTACIAGRRRANIFQESMRGGQI